MRPLLPAVILICDRLASVGCGPDGYVGLDEVARMQTVFVILNGLNRTGSGINFTLDRLEPFALPIERDNATVIGSCEP